MYLGPISGNKNDPKISEGNAMGTLGLISRIKPGYPIEEL